MEKKQLIIVIEGTGALGPFWGLIVSEFIEKIVRSFCGDEITAQNPSAAATGGSLVEFAWVIFHEHHPGSVSAPQTSGWFSDADHFLSMLESLQFLHGELKDVETTDGLAEALLMFSIPLNGYETQQALDGRRHCILISASNPYRLLSYDPLINRLDERGLGEDDLLYYDVGTLAKCFRQFSVSLSIICPEQLPKLREVYDLGKRIQTAPDPPVEVKYPDFLVLISEDFMEACAALRPPGLAPSGNPALSSSTSNVPGSSNLGISQEPWNDFQQVFVDGQGNVNVPSMALNWNSVDSSGAGQPFGTGSLMPIPGILEQVQPGIQSMPTSLTSNVPGSSILDISQEPWNNVQQVFGVGQGNVNVPSMALNWNSMDSSGAGQPFGTGSSMPIPGILEQVQPGIQSMPTSLTSNVPGSSILDISQEPWNNVQQVFGVGQGNVNVPSMALNWNSMDSSGVGQPFGTGSSMPIPGILEQVQPGLSNLPSNMPISQQASSSSSQLYNVKFWEGDLYALRQGQLALVTRLEGYRRESTSETLAADWPATMHINRFISVSRMFDREIRRRADILVFKVMNQHSCLAYMQENNERGAVIHLPSQVLLVAFTVQGLNLGGMLIPGAVVYQIRDLLLSSETSE